MGDQAEAICREHNVLGLDASTSATSGKLAAAAKDRDTKHLASGLHHAECHHGCSIIAQPVVGNVLAALHLPHTHTILSAIEKYFEAS